MDATDFIQLGIRLLGRGTEAEIRTAISRFYYGVFHIASGILQDQCGIEVPHDQAHTKVAQLYCHADEPQLEEIGRLLNSLRKARRIADYELMASEPHQVSWGQEQLLFTQEVIQALSQCSSSQQIRLATENIRRYAKDVLRLNVRNFD